jgi:hypothetical protein
MRIYSAHWMRPEESQQSSCRNTMPSARMLPWGIKPLMNIPPILKVSTYQWHKFWGLDTSLVVLVNWIQVTRGLPYKFCLLLKWDRRFLLLF